MAKNIFKVDNLKLGLLLGIVSPVISFFAYYFIRFRLFSFQEYLQAIAHNKPLLTGLIMLCLILNIVLFTIYTNMRRDKTGKGIFLVTVIFAIVGLLIKFFK